MRKTARSGLFLQVFKIDEYSLYPLYQAGDYVLVSKIPLCLTGIRPGDTVVFDHPQLGRMIKQVDHFEDGGQAVFVVGLHADSIDSRSYGAIPRHLIQGKVVWHISKK